MPQQLSSAVENNFTKGLITESTGLDFPENAATDADNCTFTIIGDTTRRLGIDKEINGAVNAVSRSAKAISSYKWNNASGDGLTQIVVEQVGDTLYFYKSSSATTSSPLSTKLLASTITISSFVASGGTFNSTLECQYADGNGYLFVYHPSCDPFYCVNNAEVITGKIITVQTRDFTGLSELNVPVNFRSPTLSDSHNYNLQNQGWQSPRLWSATSASFPNLATSGSYWVLNTGVFNYTVQAGIVGIVNGQYVNFSGTLNFIYPGGAPTIAIPATMFGQVTGYSGTTLTVNILSTSIQNINVLLSFGGGSWSISVSPTTNQISSWFTAIGNYPSNADVWWIYKNSSGVFAPATTINNFPPPTTPAPKGFYILNEFSQQRDNISGITSLTDIATTVRPRTGTWFQGRVWYTGCDASVDASGTAPAYSWTEQIYFSQIITDVSQFGYCYQTNDPTSETLFDLLPTDGGVIKIQGCGSIYKLFPIQNGMLVFAANGIWFITGSQGIGFAANDYTITKISSIRSISSTSFVDVNGLPFFWNEEGIYAVTPSQQGSLTVEPLTVGTILSFYNEIPSSSKKYVRGAYHPIDYIIQWTYKDTEESSVTDRYSYNKILNYNTYNKAFFPYTVDNSVSSINGIIYVSSPGGTNAPDSMFKYISSTSNTNMSFADEHAETYKDWNSLNYISYFITGYKLRGQAIKKFQPQYIQVYSKTNGAASSYKIQGIWNYANDRNSGKWTSEQLVTNALTRFDTVFRRHKIRGNGYALQFKVSSEDGSPFDIQGWATVDTANTGT